VIRASRQTFHSLSQAAASAWSGEGAGHSYQLLGHSPRSPVLLEPYPIVLSDRLERFEVLVHEGIEFMYVLTGSLVYRVADRTYEMAPGDSLCLEASAQSQCRSRVSRIRVMSWHAQLHWRFLGISDYAAFTGHSPRGDLRPPRRKCLICM
jgi:hypothetical protein